MGGTGGAATARTSSIPFSREAPGGRSTVRMEEVEVMKVGVEISCLLTDFLRTAPPRLATIGGRNVPGLTIGGSVD